MARKDYPSDVTDKRWQIVPPLLAKQTKVGRAPSGDIPTGSTWRTYCRLRKQITFPGNYGEVPVIADPTCQLWVP